MCEYLLQDKFFISKITNNKSQIFDFIISLLSVQYKEIETNKNDFINNYKNYKQNFNDIDIILEQQSSVDQKLDISDILILLVDLDSKNINYLCKIIASCIIGIVNSDR